MANDDRGVGQLRIRDIDRSIKYIYVSFFSKPSYTTLVDVKIMEHTHTSIKPVKFAFLLLFVHNYGSPCY